jgi:hypothetical protein
MVSGVDNTGSLMLVERIIRLTLVVLLSLGLGAGAGLHYVPIMAGAGQATLSATPSDCSKCEDCAKPCVAPTMCRTACISFCLASTIQGVTQHTLPRRLARYSDWPFSSADLRIPTPPPRLNHLV